MTASLTQLNIIVVDMRASVDFYRRLGVDLSEPTGTKEAPDFHLSGSAAGGIDLDLDTAPFAQVWNSGWAGRADLVGRIVLGFSVQTRRKVDEVHRQLTDAGYRSLSPPFDAFWGARYAIIEDPNGIAVGLMSPIDAKHRSPPPENW